MRTFLKLYIACMLCWPPAFAQSQIDFAVSNIPADLLPDANAVVRMYKMDINIVSPQEVYVAEHYAITIVNEKGQKDAELAVENSKLNSVISISGNVYDANGNKTKKLKQADFLDLPASMHSGDFNDAKIKAYKVSYRQYPYTIEYLIETKQNQTFFLPDWVPQSDDCCAVQSANLSVTAPEGMALKYKDMNFDAAPTTGTGETKQYTWHIENIHAQKKEAMSYNGSYTTPAVMLAVSDFMLDDYKGSTASWKDFGTFVYQLNKDRDVLPADIKATINKLVAGVTDDHEKIRILYAYMQRTMRYVSIDYGIGGWQTLTADFLSKNQYGDCKALSNYMMAMLAVTGITSYPVLISAGAENRHVLNTDFVCSQFNHCILCVPFAKDTTWLECTDRDLPANYLSDFTQNREALMITPQGGTLVHTPAYDASINFVAHKANVTCNEDGSLKIDMKSVYNGEPAMRLNYLLKYVNDHERDEYLNSKFRLANYTLNHYDYHKIDSTLSMRMDEDATLTATGLYTKSDSRSFLTLDIAPIYMPEQEQTGTRKKPFHICEAIGASDTFEVGIPAGYDVEFIPAPVSSSAPFGSYTYTITRNGEKLIATLKFALNSGVYSADKYDDYVKLITLADDKLHKKVVLKKKA